MLKQVRSGKIFHLRLDAGQLPAAGVQTVGQIRMSGVGVQQGPRASRGKVPAQRIYAGDGGVGPCLQSCSSFRFNVRPPKREGTDSIGVAKR